MKKINSKSSGIQERANKEKTICTHSEGITKKLLEKYKPTQAVRVLSSSRERHEDQRAA